MRHNGSDSDVLGLGDDAFVPDVIASDVLRDFNSEVPPLVPGKVLGRTYVSTGSMSLILVSRPRRCRPLPALHFLQGNTVGIFCMN